MPTIPDDLKNLDIFCENIFVKTFKNFIKVTRRDIVDCFFDGHYEKDKIPTAEIDNDPEDPSYDKTVDVISVIEIIGERKTRPKLELPNDHDRKGPKLHNDNESNKFMEKIPSKMDVGVKGKMDTNNDVHLSFDEIENNEQMDVNSPLKKSRPRSTLYLVTKSILLFVIPAVLIYMICASARGNEPGDLQPRQLKPGKGGGYNQFLEGKDSEDSQQTRPFTGNHRLNRYPTPPGTEDENSGQGVAKGKTLNVLIRKVLGKKEREKQKNMEREQMEQEKKEAEKQQEETKKEAKNDKTNDGKFHVLKKSRFDTDDEEDESSLPPTPVKGRSMFKKRVKRRSPSPQKLKSEEKKQMDISCLGESALVNESSGPFYDVNKCEQERKILECTDNSKVKACIRDNDEKSLWAVCTINICLYDQACPKVTRDLNNASVVDSQYNQCQSCKNRESLQSRLNEYGNVGAECLNISGTSPQPIGTNEDDGLDLNVAIPISVLVPIIVLGIGLGIGFWCVKYRRDRNNEQNINPEDLEQNGGAGCELLTQNGGAGCERLTQNGGAGSERLTQNGGAGSERLTQNGGAGSERLTQNGGAGSERLTQNGEAGSERLTQNGGAGSERLTQNGGASSECLTQNGGAGSERLTQNGGAGCEHLTQNGEGGSELLTQNGGAGSERLTQNGGAGSERLTQNGGAGSEHLTQNGGAGSELLTQNGEGGSELLTQNGGAGSELLTQNGGAGSEIQTQNGEEERKPLMHIGGQEVEV